MTEPALFLTNIKHSQASTDNDIQCSNKLRVHAWTLTSLRLHVDSETSKCPTGFVFHISRNGGQTKTELESVVTYSC